MRPERVLAMTRQRPSIVAVLAGLMLALGIAPAGHADAFPKLELPKSLQLTRVARAMRVNGLPTRIDAFQSEQGVAALSAYFRGQWGRQMTRTRVAPWTILAHREDDVLITVQIKRAAMGHTRGLIAETRIFDALRKGRLDPPKAAFPMLADTRQVEDLQATDHGRASRTVVLRSQQSAAQNLDFYRAYFREHGYQPVAPGALAKNAAGGAMILNRGGEQLNVAVAETDAATVITIVRVAP